MANRPQLRRAHTELPRFISEASWPIHDLAVAPALPVEEADVLMWRMTVQDGTPQSDEAPSRSSFPVTPDVVASQPNEALFADMAYRITARKALSKSASRPQTAGCPRELRYRVLENASTGSLPTIPPTAKRTGYFALAPAHRSDSLRTPPSDVGSLLSTAWAPSTLSNFKLSLRTVKVKVRTGEEVFAFRLPLNARLGDVCAALDARGACAGCCALHALRDLAWDAGFDPAPLLDDDALRANLRAASKAEDSLRLVAL